MNPLSLASPYSDGRTIKSVLSRKWTEADYYRQYAAAFHSLSILTEMTRDVACRNLARLCALADSQIEVAKRSQHEPAIYDKFVKAHIASLRAIACLEATYGLRPERLTHRAKGTTRAIPTNPVDNKVNEVIDSITS